MKIKIKVEMNDGTPAVELTTNLFGLISSVFGASEGTTGFVDIVIGAGKFLAEIFQYIGKAIGIVIKVIDFALTPVFYVLAGGLHLVIGVFNILWGGLKLVIDVFSKLMDIIQDVGTFFSGLMDMILFAVGKLTKGLAMVSLAMMMAMPEGNANWANNSTYEKTYDTYYY